MRITDEAFRARLGPDGILGQEHVDVLPAREACFCVFAQRPDARVEAATWERHAATFFASRVGLAVPKRYGPGGFPEIDAAMVVLAPKDGPGSTRLLFGRPRAPVDLDVAMRADAALGSPGLYALARRCPTVWLVEPEGEGDRVALLLAAILASVVLGPIVAPGPDGDIFGVRTARAKLELMGP